MCLHAAVAQRVACSESVPLPPAARRGCPWLSLSLRLCLSAALLPTHLIRPFALGNGSKACSCVGARHAAVVYEQESRLTSPTCVASMLHAGTQTTNYAQPAADAVLWDHSSAAERIYLLLRRRDREYVHRRCQMNATQQKSNGCWSSRSASSRLAGCWPLRHGMICTSK